MYEYVGFIWNEHDVRQHTVARRLVFRLQALSGSWTRQLQVDGMAVFDRGARPTSTEACPLEGERGVVLGTLFERAVSGDACKRLRTLNEGESRRVVSSAGARLLDNYWGRYVAFLHEPERRHKFILVDPFGGLPCLYAMYKGITIVFSRIQLWAQLGLPAFPINWEFIATHVLLSAIQMRHCGLIGVSELVGGECLEMKGDERQSRLLWKPMAFAHQTPIENAAEATDQLRAATIASVKSWAACYPGVLHTLSGGLDSSIILACLATGSRVENVTCVNYITESPDGDEREYARSAAARAKYALVECKRNPSVLDMRRLRDLSPHVRPWSYRYSLEHTHVEAQLATENHAAVIFSGGGGDQVFYNTYVNLAVRDFIYQHGLKLDVWKVAWDVARIERRSIWSVLKEGVSQGLRKRTFDFQSEAVQQATLASDELLRRDWTSNTTPPWFEDSSKLPVGKYWQAFSLSIPSVFYDPLAQDDNPEHVKPLRSQPLIELALRIPTYVQIHGGWDRALARRAFRNELPSIVLKRRTKGGMGDHTVKMLQANIGFVREMLLDGELVRHQILDRKKLEAVLYGHTPIVSEDFFTIEEHISTELWLRNWGQQRKRAVA